MAAELHLAEDALPLHLLFQHLEGLVDVVVTDENLHAAFLFGRAVNGPIAKAPGPLANGWAPLGCRQHRWQDACVDIATVDIWITRLCGRPGPKAQ